MDLREPHLVKTRAATRRPRFGPIVQSSAGYGPIDSLRVPFLRRRIAHSTFFDADLPDFAI